MSLCFHLLNIFQSLLFTKYHSFNSLFPLSFLNNNFPFFLFGIFPSHAQIGYSFFLPSFYYSFNYSCQLHLFCYFLLCELFLIKTVILSFFLSFFKEYFCILLFIFFYIISSYSNFLQNIFLSLIHTYALSHEKIDYFFLFHFPFLYFLLQIILLIFHSFFLSLYFFLFSPDDYFFFRLSVCHLFNYSLIYPLSHFYLYFSLFFHLSF